MDERSDKGKARGELSEQEYKKKIESIKRFERQLTDNGYLLMKFFFQIDEKEQKKRLDKLADDKNTSWRVSEHDVWQNKHYDKCMDVYEQYLCDTNQSSAPWYLVDAKDKKWAQLQILETLVQGIDTALQNSTLAVPLLQNAFPLKPIEKLADVALDKTLTEEEYDTLLNQYQKRPAANCTMNYTVKKYRLSLPMKAGMPQERMEISSVLPKR